MPIVSRARLRQHVGQRKLHDTYVGNVTFAATTEPVQSGVIMVWDTHLADLTLSGQGVYRGAWIGYFGSQFTIASFNVGSGALMTFQQVDVLIGPGEEYEIHRKVSPIEKNRAIDGIIGHLWTRQEIPINAVPGRLNYSIGNGFKVFGAYSFANPTGTTSRDPQPVQIAMNIVTTATGRELRLQPGTFIGSGQQLILDAQVRATLGATDTATVNIPDEDWVLTGIAARCYEALIADAPGQEAGKYRDLANAYAREFVKGVGRYRDPVSTDFANAFDEVVV